MTAPRKVFTIEKQALSESPVPEAIEEAPPSGPGGVHHVLVKLDELGAMIQPTQAIVSSIADAYRLEVIAVMKLREEMDAIQNAIIETKRQVVSLHSSVPRAVKMNHAAGELGAAVIDAEGATHTILTAAEHIGMLSSIIQNEVTPDAMRARAAEIAAKVMTIYEACNFQDLTGQRITRVCETLHFVEGRVHRMTEIWGGLDTLNNVMATEIDALNEEHNALGTHALAAGPALAGSNDHVAQPDIDALFD
jgi:chemotaxis protein CheZ